MFVTDHGWHSVHLHLWPRESRVSSGVERAHEPRVWLAIVVVLRGVVERIRGQAALCPAPVAECFALLHGHRLEELLQLLLGEPRHAGHARRWRGRGGIIRRGRCG